MTIKGFLDFIGTGCGVGFCEKGNVRIHRECMLHLFVRICTVYGIALLDDVLEDFIGVWSFLVVNCAPVLRLVVLGVTQGSARSNEWNILYIHLRRKERAMDISLL